MQPYGRVGVPNCPNCIGVFASLRVGPKGEAIQRKVKTNLFFFAKTCFLAKYWVIITILKFKNVGVIVTNFSEAK